MKPGHRAPITPEEREAMRQRRLEGKSLEEIAQEFSCSRVSAQKICANLIERTFQTGKPISQEKIDKIIAYRKEGRTQSDVARMVGVTPHVVSKYTPPELKISRPRLKGGKPKRVRGLPQNLAGPPVRWSQEEIKILLDMTKTGAGFREIALKMGRSYVSVKDKVGRLSKIKPIKHEKEPEIKFEKKPKFVASKCLKCLKMFESFDPRKNRICGRCKSNEGWSL